MELNGDYLDQYLNVFSLSAKNTTWPTTTVQTLGNYIFIYIYIAADISKPSETSERRTSTAASKAVIGEKLLGFE